MLPIFKYDKRDNSGAPKPIPKSEQDAKDEPFRPVYCGTCKGVLNPGPNYSCTCPAKDASK